VNPQPLDLTETEVAEAEARLASLGTRVETLQAVLVRLLQDVVRAESRLNKSRPAELAAVNEQLVVAALTSRDDAEAAAQTTGLDALTGLPNRQLLRDHFAQAMANARRHRSRCALLFLDIDDFKQLNDAHGHAFGDQVLRQVARRLVSAVREVDTVSRYGGDEFIVLLFVLGMQEDAEAVADKLTAVIRAPAEIDGRTISVTASVGIAVYPDDGQDLDALIARADAAMYESKRRSTGRIGAEHDAPAQRAASAGPATRRQEREAPDADRDRLLFDLQEANEKLVLAALSAQQLHAAAERARQRQSAVLAALSRELSDPKAPIRMAAAMLGLPADQDKLLPRAQAIFEEQIEQITRLVEAANTQAGGLPLEPHALDMAAVIDRAIAAQRPLFEAGGLHFTLHRAPGAIEVEGDAQHLEHVVSSLLENASRQTHDGGHIDLYVDVHGDALTLTFTDDGIGITPELLPLIFEPFVQDPRALSSSGRGLGIGLAVARALVRAHDGQITAHSEGPSHGSRFVMTLPLGRRTGESSRAPIADGIKAR
jgi:diguanylate cyclase (GGDEF)-like protein